MSDQKLAPRFNHKLMSSTGIVFGMPGVAYDQGGVLYNDGFIAVDSSGNPIKMVEPPKPSVPQVAPQPAAAADDDDTPEDEKAIDLEGWVAGTKAYRFGVIVAHLQEVSGQKAKDKEQAMALANRVLAGEFAGLKAE